jgi:hypothetical protein
VSAKVDVGAWLCVEGLGDDVSKLNLKREDREGVDGPAR